MKTKRKLALEAGDTLYFTGKACKKGHVAPKRASNGSCTECECLKNNSEARKSYMANYADSNRDKFREIASRWQKNNKGKVNAETAKRHAAKLCRTPKWLSKEDKEVIKDLYSFAAILTKYSGIPYHVDHIIPMQGENVCGLHVPNNLRVIPAVDNMRKGNRLNGTEFPTLGLAEAGI